MVSSAQPAPASKWMLWGGYIASAIPVLMLLFGGVLKLVKPDFLVEEFERLGDEFSKKTTVTVADSDLDGIPDYIDDCPTDADPSQLDQKR